MSRSTRRPTLSPRQIDALSRIHDAGGTRLFDSSHEHLWARRDRLARTIQALIRKGSVIDNRDGTVTITDHEARLIDEYGLDSIEFECATRRIR